MTTIRDDASVCSGCGERMPDEVVDQLCEACSADETIDPPCSEFDCILTIKQHEYVTFGQEGRFVLLPVHQTRES